MAIRKLTWNKRELVNDAPWIDFEIIEMKLFELGVDRSWVLGQLPSDKSISGPQPWVISPTFDSDDRLRYRTFTSFFSLEMASYCPSIDQ